MLHTETDRLGLRRCTVHSLRHSYATTLIDAGYPIATVTAILGDSSSRVTEYIYQRLPGSDFADAADVITRAVAR